jgi:WD40 repeat protein
MSDDLPNTVIIDRILPFVDRSTWDNLVVANREIYEGSRNLEAPWPVSEVRGVGYEGDEIKQLCFSSDGKYLCVRSSQANGLVDQQRIRMWHKVVGSCGYIAFDGNDTFADMGLWRVYFSPVESLLVSLHIVDGRQAFQLWEVNTGGMVFKVEVQLDRVAYILSCTFSQDGRQLVLHCGDNTLRIYSVSDAQLIKVIHPIGHREGVFLRFVGITADGRQCVFVQYQLSSLVAFRVFICDIHGYVSTFEDIYVCHKGEHVSNIAISPLDDSIAIMTRTGIIKLAHRRARDTTWTVEVLADGKCFDTLSLSFSTGGQLLASVCVDKGVEIWDPIKGKCIRTIVCDQLSKLEFSSDGSLLAATTSSDGRLCMYNI